MERADEFYVPAGFGEAEHIEKRSRFIGRVWPAGTEEEALERLKETREKHWDASHNVYAYIIREGGIMRYSDDGEPQGTSGMPVLGVFRSAEVCNVLCVVTRYFGGVLLGAGGLVRAYSHAAALALDAAGIAAMRLWDEAVIVCPYPLLERVKNEIGAFMGHVMSADYGAEVRISAIIPKEGSEGLVARLNDISSGKLKIEHKGENYRPIRIK